MTKKEFQKLEKEIIRQMGVDNISDAYLKGDWTKVDPAIREKYVKEVAAHISDTMNNMHGSDVIRII